MKEQDEENVEDGNYGNYGEIKKSLPSYALVCRKGKEVGFLVMSGDNSRQLDEFFLLAYFF